MDQLLFVRSSAGMTRVRIEQKAPVLALRQILDTRPEGRMKERKVFLKVDITVYFARKPLSISYSTGNSTSRIVNKGWMSNEQNTLRTIFTPQEMSSLRF